MAKKKKPEEHENHERWLVSYADFITLLFAFFVVLYSISSRDAAKIKKLQMSLAKSFGTHDKGPMEGSNGRPFIGAEADRAAPILNTYRPKDEDFRPPPEKIFDEKHPLRMLEKEVQATLVAQGAKRAFNVRLWKRGLYITVNQEFLFASGPSAIYKDYKPALVEIAKKIRNLPNDIALEGLAIPLARRPLQTSLDQLNAETATLQAFLTDEIQISKERIVGISVVGTPQSGLARPDDLGGGSYLDIIVLRDNEE